VRAAPNGGAAFPMPGADYTEDCGDFNRPAYHGPQQGMTLRDYFMAHAPAEPQPWFQPVMPMEAPTAPQFPRDLTDAEKRDQEVYLGDSMEVSDMGQHRVRAYHEQHAEYVKASRAWKSEQDKQRFIQWPVAWADEMLKARRSNG
jgi:hypothetical protein